MHDPQPVQRGSAVGLQLGEAHVDQLGHLVGLQLAQNRTECFQVTVAGTPQNVSHARQRLFAPTAAFERTTQLLQQCHVIRGTPHFALQTAQ